MTKAKIIKDEEKLIEKAYYESCDGCVIGMLDIPKVFEHGRKLINQGATYDALKDGLRKYVKENFCAVGGV